MDTPVTAVLSGGRLTQHHWLELWPAQHMDHFQISHHGAPTSPPSLKNLPPKTSTTTGTELGVFGLIMAWPNCGKKELLWWSCCCPRSYPHSELVIVEGLQVEGGTISWSKLEQQVRRKEKI